MTRRDELLAALAQAESALARAVARAPAVDATRTEPDAEVVKVRAQCRQLRAALGELGRLEAMAEASERSGTTFSGSEEASRRGFGAYPHYRGGSRRAAHRGRFASGLLALVASPGGALLRPTLLRQSIGLFSLTFAYLAYYYIDVQLQILSLPRNFL